MFSYWIVSQRIPAILETSSLMSFAMPVSGLVNGDQPRSQEFSVNVPRLSVSRRTTNGGFGCLRNEFYPNIAVVFEFSELKKNHHNPALQVRVTFQNRWIVVAQIMLPAPDVITCKAPSWCKDCANLLNIMECMRGVNEGLKKNKCLIFV